jgi:hypothetical protein
MNIGNEVYQQILAFFEEGQEKESGNTTQIEVQFDGDESKPYYIAWIHRQTGVTDPESGRLATLLTWARFSYINEKLTFIAGSWEHMLVNQMRTSYNVQLQKQAEESRVVERNETIPINR